MTMLARCRLQLAFHQALQLRQSLGLVEQRLEWPAFTQKRAGSPGRGEAVGHGGYLRIRAGHLTRSLPPALREAIAGNLPANGLKLAKMPLL